MLSLWVQSQRYLQNTTNTESAMPCSAEQQKLPMQEGTALHLAKIVLCDIWRWSLCSYFPGLCFLYIQVFPCHLQWDTTCTGLLHARFCDGFHHSLLLSHWSFFSVCTFSKKTACWALSPLGLIPQAFLDSRSYNKECRKNRADQWTQSCCAVVFSPLTQSMRICFFLPIFLCKKSHISLLLLSQKVLSKKLPSFLFG